MSKQYSASKLVAAERAKEKRTQLNRQFSDALCLAVKIGTDWQSDLTPADYTALPAACRQMICAAQELENLSKGNPAPTPSR